MNEKHIIQHDIETLYKLLSKEDKAIVDNIFSRYKDQEQKSVDSKIG